MSSVFVSIDWFVPGTNAGGPVRSIVNLISALPETKFFVFTRNIDYCSTSVYSNVVSDSWVKYSPNCMVFYCSKSLLNKTTLSAQLELILPDVLYINGIYSRSFSIWPLDMANRLHIKTIVATRGMLSPHSLRQKFLKKYFFLTWMRWKNAYRTVRFHATSEVEKQDIVQVLGNQSLITVVPNLPRVNVLNPLPIPKEQYNLKLVCIGRIAPEKGILQALLSLRGQKSKITLQMFGTCYNPVYWQKCKSVIAELPPNVSVYYNGPCEADDVAGHISDAHALLLPSTGENFGHAIVESLGLGRPVLISKHTPWQNLKNVKAGFDVDDSEIPNAIAHFAAMKQSAYNEWSQGALNYYLERIAIPFEENKQAYLKLFET